MKTKLSVYWSRRDFRLHDNPALSAAAKYSKEENCELLPIFILENYMTEADTKFQFGSPSRYFLSCALPEFSKNFNNFAIVKGKAAESLINIAKDFDIKIFVNEDVYIDFYKQIKKLQKNNIEVEIFNDQMTVDKETRSGTGNYYSVFTPFKNAVWKEFLSAKVVDEANLKDINFISDDNFKKIENKVEVSKANIWKAFSHERKFEAGGNIYDVDSLLSFKPDFFIDEKAQAENRDFYFTEDYALKHFKKYVKEELSQYKENRDSLEKDRTSKMSLALAWGLVSSRSLKAEIQQHFDEDFIAFAGVKEIAPKYVGAVHFVSELIWREFYKYLLYRKPELMDTEFQEKFRGTINWTSDRNAKIRFEAWIQGRTGYKVVDAAMMQLAKSGWMHNRSRMIVASVLTKNLGVDWRWGQEYFRAMLLDLDEASNNGGWQWGASVGADPKPIRIFNPYLQAENYDKNNIYQKKWLGDDFFFGPEPLIEHKDARVEALKRYGLDGEKNLFPRDY